MFNEALNPSRVVRKFVCPGCGVLIQIEQRDVFAFYRYWHGDFAAYGETVPEEDTLWFCLWIIAFHGGMGLPSRVPLWVDPSFKHAPEMDAIKRLKKVLGI